MTTKTSNKRQIRGQQFDIEKLVDEALAQVEGQPLDTEAARASLTRLGHNNPADSLVERYARESAILRALGRTTGANFDNQIGKIDFSTRQAAIDGVQSYLWRRVHGMRSQWSGGRR